MQTARADILYTSRDDSVQVRTRILFASGSQRSYICDKVRHALQLKAIRVEKVVIKTYGQVENSEVKELDVVQLKIKNKGDSRFTFVEAYVSQPSVVLLQISPFQVHMNYLNLVGWNLLILLTNNTTVSRLVF